MRGFSITLCFGSYAGFYANFQSMTWRVCLGWVALTVYPQTDIEKFIESLAKENQ